MILRLLKYAIVFSLLVTAGAGLWLKNHLDNYGDTPINLPASSLYELQRGTSFIGLLSRLEQQGIIESQWKLRLYAHFNDEVHQIKSGEYRLQPGQSYRQLLEQFAKGDVVQRQVTLVEGLRLQDYLLAFAEQNELVHTLEGKTYAEIAELVGYDGDNPEGWFFPDTYSFTKGATDLDILKRAYKRTQQVLEQEWRQRAKDLPLKSPYEALILASIVEKETGAPEEREQIAGVFIRRLEKGMRLQTDPTVIYGMGDRYEGKIRRSDLNQHTPYNTYRIDGLPPTPIASAGQEAIHAALQPADGKALYFVAKGDGRHYFSATLKEHNNAVNEYQRNRREDYRSFPAAQGDN